MTCEQGENHRWDEHRSRCLDCGRDAATIADELWEWLGQTEDARDRDADHLAEAHDLLERAEGLMLAPHGNFSGWLSDYAAFAAKYPQEDGEEAHELRNEKREARQGRLRDRKREKGEALIGYNRNPKGGGAYGVVRTSQTDVGARHKIPCS